MGKTKAYQPLRARLLVVEPESLLRWSLVTYLSRYFEIRSVTACDDADEMVRTDRFDAIVISDQIAPGVAANIERQARGRNPAVRIVRTVTDSHGEVEDAARVRWLEKPFRLAELAELLGVGLANNFKP